MKVAIEMCIGSGHRNTGPGRWNARLRFKTVLDFSHRERDIFPKVLRTISISVIFSSPSSSQKNKVESLVRISL